MSLSLERSRKASGCQRRCCFLHVTSRIFCHFTRAHHTPKCLRQKKKKECQATEVIGQVWSSEVVELFLEDWEHGRVTLSCHMAMDLLCQEMSDACSDSSESLRSPNCHSNKVFLSPWTGCDNQGEGCGERNEGRRNVSGGPF